MKFSNTNYPHKNYIEQSPTVNAAEFPHETDEPSAAQVPETDKSPTVNPAEFHRYTHEPPATQCMRPKKRIHPIPRVDASTPPGEKMNLQMTS